jgi:hypothetical protein
MIPALPLLRTRKCGMSTYAARVAKDRSRVSTDHYTKADLSLLWAKGRPYRDHQAGRHGAAEEDPDSG